MAPSGSASALLSHVGSQRMQLRYGFNEIDAWWHIGLGPHRHRIQRRLRRMGTDVVRIFVFDKPVPDPMREWHLFAAYVQAVLDAGAVPMVTFAKFHPPHTNPRNLRAYVERAKEVVWGCLEQWGGERVGDWYWCVWNEPNNVPVGGGLDYPTYRHIYRELAGALQTMLAPHLGGRKARIGGPAADTFQPFWLDWIAALVEDIDERLLSFVSWHRYGDWRPVVPGSSIGFDMLGAPDAPSDGSYRRLLMGQTPGYEASARAVGRLLAGRDILNVCGELNTIVSHDYAVVGGLNQSHFGAAYYASALIHLIRGGADLEMRWTATDNDDAYGLITPQGDATPAGIAKQLFAAHVRHGDLVYFPADPGRTLDLDVIAATGSDGRHSTVFVHSASNSVHIRALDWDPALAGAVHVWRLDAGTGARAIRAPFDGKISLDGYGLAVVTNNWGVPLEDGDWVGATPETLR